MHETLSTSRAFHANPSMVTCATALVLGGLAATTQSQYKVGQSKYLLFGQHQGLAAGELFPPTPATVLAFLSWLFLLTRRVSYGTAKSYLCHVKTLCKLLGHNTDAAFRSPQLEYALRAYRKERPVLTRPARLPITVQLLHKFRSFLDLSGQLEDRMLFAVLCVGVYGLFRSGELAMKTTADNSDILLRGDVRWASDARSCAINLRMSKTDPLRDGVTVTLWANDTITCPVSHLRRWWLSAPNQSSTAPLFQRADSSPLLYTQLNESIKLLAHKAGLDAKRITGHSLRVGGATSLAMMGVPEHVIQQLGRWRSLCYQLYVRMTDDYKESLSQKLGKLGQRPQPNASQCFGGLSVKSACDLSMDRIGAAFRAR